MRWLTRPSRARVRKARLAVNSLEGRITPAKVPVLTVDASHSFVSQLQAAQPGSVIQIEPGATIGTLGTSGMTTAAANAGDTTIQVDHAFAAGQFVNITDGTNVDNVLVDGVSGSASPFTLTLHTPLANGYAAGATVTSATNILGIGKGITIQGDPKKPAATLFNATALQLVPQNGAAVPTALTNLALQSLGGYASSNLTLSKDTITSNGPLEPFQAYVARALTVDDVTFTAGAAATLNNVVAVSTGAGSINFNDVTVNAQSDLGATAVALNSSSGPITVDDFTLTAQGLVGGDGLNITTGGNVVVTGKANTLTFAKTVGMNGINISNGANASVSNVTAKFTANVSASGIVVNNAGNATASNLSVTVGGNVGSDGIFFNPGGSGIVSDLSVNVTGTADSGMDLAVGGNLTVAGAEAVNVTGAVSNFGMYVYASAGSIDISTPLAVTLGATTGYGVYVYASNGSITESQPVTANVTGAVSYEGVYLYADSDITVGTITVNLQSTVNYGIDVEGYSMVLNGPLTANVKGDVANAGVYVYDYESALVVSKPIVANLGGSADEGVDVETGEGDLTIKAPLTATIAGNVSSQGVYVYGYDDTTIAAPIQTTIGGTARYGAYLYGSSGSFTATAPISVSVTGNVSRDGLYLYANDDVALSGKLTVDLGGTAQYGAYLYSSSAKFNSSGKTAVTVAGQVSQDGLYMYGYTGGTIQNVQVTLKNGAGTYGAYFNGYYGDLTVSNVDVNVAGPVNEGLYTYTYGTMTASKVSLELGSTSGYGLDLESGDGALVVSKCSATLNGDVGTSGVYLYSYSGMNVSGLTATLAGQSGSQAVYSESYYGDAFISGLNVTETGAASGTGVELHTEDANISLTKSTITMNGAVATNALEVDATYGNVSVSKTTVAAKAVGTAGFTAKAAGSLTVAKNTVTTAGGTAAKLTGTSGDPQVITKNAFNTGGTGIGLQFTGGSSVVAAVSGNNFQGNLVGVSIVGDGTDAGNIDLGGGLLGSKGKNNFSGYTGTGGNYAISLTNTNATSTVSALGNTFTASDATATIQDQAHNGGTGIVKLS